MLPCRVLLCPACADHFQDVAETCGVSAMPTFQVYKGGQKVDEMVGAVKDKLTALIEKYA